ncbi:transcription factor that binds to CRE motif [Collariella sp. IMI 366227]|nr:transcription factor that binds to CRE motif [Collariella sp. IMI 366227]
MDSWASHTASPSIKFEDSPTESLLSAPDEMYPSLFGNTSSPATTVSPLEMMSPQSFTDEPQSDLGVLALSAITQSALSHPPNTSADGTPEPEKKSVKKRKSWGQVLPEPKTNLPPRKRAKTEDEKEQRRVERVLRNRRAAQSSRERKRLEVEGLEKRNKELEAALLHVQQVNLRLFEEVQKLQQATGVVSRTSSSFDALRQPPVTFSPQLFDSHDSHGASIGGASSLERVLSSLSASNETVDPASLSPALSPIPEAADEQTPLPDVPMPSEAKASPDTTQHPAAIGLLSSPNSTDLEYDHLAGDDATPFSYPSSTYDFDFTEFIADGELHIASSNEQQPQHLRGRSVTDASLLFPETPNPSEDPYLQPHSGASLDGCDDGGIAVGVL